MVIKEFIQSLQEKRLKKAALTASPSERTKIAQQIFIIEQNKSRKNTIDKARAKARFESQLREAQEQPTFDEGQRQASQQFKLKTIRRKGALPAQKKKGVLAGFDKFLAGTGVAKGSAPIVRGTSGLGGGGGGGFSPVTGSGGGLGGFGGGGGFSPVTGFASAPAAPAKAPVKRRKRRKRR